MGKKRWRDESIRLQNWDYSSPGFYFVTICTRDREKFFGHINDGKMILNNAGIIAYNQWLKINQNFNHIILDEFIIMPNHIHAILKICYNPNCQNKHANVCNTCRDAINRVPNGNYNNDENNGVGGITGNKNPMINRLSISYVLRSYKSTCTKMIRNLQNDDYFGWQPKFHDRLIRDDHSLHRIREYIKDNPAKWWRDRNKPENLYM